VAGTSSGIISSNGLGTVIVDSLNPPNSVVILDGMSPLKKSSSYSYKGTSLDSVKIDEIKRDMISWTDMDRYYRDGT